MIVDEQSRNELYVGLQEVLGPDRATILMAYLSPFPWSDLATKQDLVALRVDFESLRVATKEDFAALRVATKQDIAALRGDLEAHRVVTKADFAALRGDFESLRVDTKDNFAALRVDFEAHRVATKADIEEKFDHHTKILRFEMADHAKSFTLALGDHRDVLRKEMIQQTWVIVFALIATVISLAGVFMAAD